MEYIQLPLFPLEPYEIEAEPPTPPDPTLESESRPLVNVVQLVLPGYEDFFDPELEKPGQRSPIPMHRWRL